MTAGERILIGFRPEALQLAAPGSSDAISGRVRLIEHMGSDVFVHVEMPDTSGLFVMRLPLERACRIELGEPLQLGLRPGQLLFFDARGRRITTSSSVAPIEQRAFG